MKKFAYSLLALAAMSSVALAEPAKMTDSQMDAATAGFLNTTVNISVPVVLQMNVLSLYSSNYAVLLSNSPVHIKLNGVSY